MEASDAKKAELRYWKSFLFSSSSSSTCEEQPDPVWSSLTLPNPWASHLNFKSFTLLVAPAVNNCIFNSVCLFLAWERAQLIAPSSWYWFGCLPSSTVSPICFIPFVYILAHHPSSPFLLSLPFIHPIVTRLFVSCSIVYLIIAFIMFVWCLVVQLLLWSCFNHSCYRFVRACLFLSQLQSSSFWSPWVCNQFLLCNMQRLVNTLPRKVP